MRNNSIQKKYGDLIRRAEYQAQEVAEVGLFPRWAEGGRQRARLRHSTLPEVFVRG